MTITLSTLMNGGTSPTSSAATNIAGGTTGQIPYQSAASSTNFFGPGTSGYVLVGNGASAPSFTNALALTGTISASNYSGTSSGTNTGDQTTITGNAGTATKVVGPTLSAAATADLVYAQISDNDYARIRVGGDATNTGWIEIATADDGTEPIYVRQYTGVFATVTRTAILLDGSGNTTFPGVTTTTATAARYADLAENYTGDADYPSGTIVMFGGKEEVTVCNTDMSSRIAGIVSANPAHLMNSELKAEFVVPVALQGRVDALVQGTVRKGDMMVSAGNGRARAEAHPVMGSVIGKALADFDGDFGIIEIVVGRL